MFNEAQKLEMEQNQDDWHSLFRQLDINNDGFIVTRNLYQAVSESAASMGLSIEERDALLYNVDSNHDSVVDFGEFCTLMAKAKRWHLQRSVSITQLIFRLDCDAKYTIIIYAARSVLHKRSQPRTLRYLVQEYNCFPPPLFMILISLVEISIYLYYALESREKISAVGPVPISSVLILDPHKKTQLWRIATYIFIHVGFVHLLTNVIVQLLLGLPLELVHKLWRIGALYILGACSGGLLVMACDPSVFLGGASGAAYALLSAHASDLIINWNEMEFNFIRAAVFVALVLVDVGVAVYQRYYAEIINRTSYVSHLGGFIAGLLLGVVLLRNLKWHKYEVYVWWTCLVAFLVYIAVLGVLIYSPPLF